VADHRGSAAGSRWGRRRHARRGALLRSEVETILATLSQREQVVIRPRLGLDDGRARTLDEVGRDDQIDYGALWEKVVCHQIDTCVALVVIMSPHAAESTWVANEIARAELRRRPILPLLLAGDVLFRLGHLQYVDVTNETMPGPRFTSQLRNLVQQYSDIGSLSSRSRPDETPRPAGQQHQYAG
jgi:TIR domain